MAPAAGVSQVSVAMKMAERPLDFGQAPATGHVHGVDEKGPGVLQVGDQRHADHAQPELKPAPAGVAPWRHFRHGHLWAVHFQAL